MTTRRFLTLMLAACAVAGCASSHRQTFEGHTPTQVWTALTAVAESPRYEDWTISSNEVWTDDADNRVEIHRKIKRKLYRPSADPLLQKREFRLQISLIDQDPPTVRFRSRGLQIPAHVWEERDRFFADVTELLDGNARPAMEANAPN